ncbi:hypothetical protein ACIRG5_03745 [Lentzea sp. NPDC102401]
MPSLVGFGWNPERIFEDGDHVGRIVEHRDVVQPYVPAGKTVSGNDMV